MTAVASPSSVSSRSRRQFILTAALAAGMPATHALGASPAVKAAVAPTSFYANFAGMSLKDQEGRNFDPSRLQGRVVLVNFVYTGCSTVCPVQVSQLAELQRQLPQALRQQVHFLSVSIDPLQDTPAALKQFAQRMSVDLGGWTLITGKPDEIKRLADKLTLFRPEPDAKRPADHSAALWLVDTRGELRMRYNGNPPDIPRLLREIPQVRQLTAG